MRSKVFKIVFIINIIALGILFGTWWVNGREDTWLYATSAIIVLSSFLYVSPRKKDGDQ